MSVTHAHTFTDGREYRGQKALIIGTGNSAHDIAQDLHSNGVDTTIVQRGSTTVVSISPSAVTNYAIYNEGPPLEDCDLLAATSTYPLVVRGYQMAVKRMVELDKDLIAGLKRHRVQVRHRRRRHGPPDEVSAPRRRLLSQRRRVRPDDRRRDRFAPV